MRLDWVWTNQTPLFVFFFSLSLPCDFLCGTNSVRSWNEQTTHLRKTKNRTYIYTLLIFRSPRKMHNAFVPDWWCFSSAGTGSGRSLVAELCFHTHSERLTRWLPKTSSLPLVSHSYMLQPVKRRKTCSRLVTSSHRLSQLRQGNNPNCRDANVAEEGPSLFSPHKCHLFISSISSTALGDFYGYSCNVTAAPCYF